MPFGLTPVHLIVAVLVMLVWIAIAALVLRLAALVVAGSRRDDAVHILRRRKASGAISQAEFEEALRILGR